MQGEKRLREEIHERVKEPRFDELENNPALPLARVRKSKDFPLVFL